MKIENQTPQHAELLQLFTTEFEKYYRHMDAQTLRGLLRCAPMVFAKWYHTALAAETILTPANIVSSDLRNTKNTETAYVLSIHNDAAGLEKYHFRLLTYCVDNHPLLTDLQILADFFLPDRTVDETGFLLPEDADHLLPRLSFPDPFYLEFLTRLCHQIGLLRKAPAIHIHKMTKSSQCDAFFSQDAAVLLDTLLWESCALAAERMQATMDLEPGLVSSSFFHSYLESHQEVDRIFVDFYRRVDVDLEKIWNIPPSDMTEEEHAIISSFLFAGIMLDKWFFTPMSLFFRVIRPISFTPFRFYQTVNHLSALLLMRHNTGAELFTPPTYYSLTALGNILTAKHPLPADKQNMPQTLSYHQLLDAIMPEMELRMYEELLRLEYHTEVTALRVDFQKNTQLWKEIELTTENQLHDFCCDICAAFGMEQVQDYLLSVPDANGYPLDYSPIGSKRSINKTASLTVGDLPLTEGCQWTLIPPAGKQSALLITVLEKKNADPYVIYPRVRRQSETISELEQIDEFY